MAVVTAGSVRWTPRQRAAVQRGHRLPEGEMMATTMPLIPPLCHSLPLWTVITIAAAATTVWGGGDRAAAQEMHGGCPWAMRGQHSTAMHAGRAHTDKGVFLKSFP